MNFFLFEDLPFISFNISVQSSKHWPHDSQYGTEPLVPRAHLSQYLPDMPFLHTQSPVTLSHCWLIEPKKLHLQSKRKNLKISDNYQ